jgi:5-methyltetrahydrofolate corrinoid/iron sulfur protein methyltransferase
MLVIGELINGMYKQVAEAIATRDEKAIQQLAKEQIASGANVLDVNTGPAAEDPVEAMRWLVETIQKVVDVPLAIDSTKPQVIEEGLKLVSKKAIINSTTAEAEKLDIILSLASKYNAQVIGLTMDKKGIPRDRVQRSELALKIITGCMEKGIDLSDLYIDPVVLPVNVAQAQQV